MSLSREDFIGAMRRFPGAANIVTTGSGDQRAGFTATACISLTADPPQVGVAVNKGVSAYPQLVANKSFCINTLASDQHELAARFAGPVKGEARFLEGDWGELTTGAPVLGGAVVNLDCVVVETLELTTHTLFVGRVVAASQSEDARSLLYVDGDWASLLPATSRDVVGLMQGIEKVSAAIDSAVRKERDPSDSLDTFVREWTKIYTDRHDVVHKYMSAELYASPSDIKRLNAARREFDDKLTELLASGGKAGFLEVGDPRLTAFAIAGMVGWTHRWFRPEGRLRPDEIGEQLARLVRKLVAPSAAMEEGQRTVA